MDTSNLGATQDDWTHFDLCLGLTEDLLPVVSNTAATISPDSKMQGIGKTPSIYNGNRHVAGIPNWTQQRAGPKQIKRWSKEPDYGICIQTRRVRAIDVDVDNAEDAARILAFIEQQGFSLPRRVRSNSSKFLLAFTCLGDLTKRKFTTTNGIVEFLATGQQFIACGTHTSGARYEWEGGLPAEMPEITLEQFESLWSALAEAFATAESQTSAPSVKREKLAGAVSSDPVAQHLYDHDMVKGLGNDGRLHVVCPFEHEHTSDTGDTATVYWPAHTGGYANGHFHCLHAHCEHRADDEFKEAIGYVDQDILAEFETLTTEAAIPMPEGNPQGGVDGLPGDAQVDGGLPQAASKFAVVPADTFSQRKPPSWIVKGVLPKAELVVLFGESGAGKSFVSLDIAMAIARGLPWRGCRTKQGRVAYIAAEGAGGFRNRLVAYRDHVMHAGFGTDEGELDNFGVIHAAPNLLEKADALEVAKSVIAWNRADVIFVDTLAQTMPGGNENAGEDMGKVLAHCKGIHRATGATVVLIHHAGKDTTRGARGWSGLRAAADAEIEVIRAADGRMVRISKQKDGDDALAWGFRLEQVQIGVDEDGDSITSCVVVEADLPDLEKRAAKKVGPWEKMILEVVGEIALSQTQGIEVEHVLKEVASRMPKPENGKRDTRKQHAKRALNGLCEGDDPRYLVEGDCLSIL